MPAGALEKPITKSSIVNHKLNRLNHATQASQHTLADHTKPTPVLTLLLVMLLICSVLCSSILTRAGYIIGGHQTRPDP